MPVPAPQPGRLIIPACIGCGAMRSDQGCPGECRERPVELVNGADFDRLATAAAAGRERLRALRAVAGELARAEPAEGGWQAAYQALARPARSALRQAGPAAGPGPGGADDPLRPARTVTVWRCQDCGGLDAPQPCLGVCIWRPAAWVEAARYEQERSAAAAGREAGRSLTRLLRALAFATPRPGQWERSGRALQDQARCLLRPDQRPA